MEKKKELRSTPNKLCIQLGSDILLMDISRKTEQQKTLKTKNISAYDYLIQELNTIELTDLNLMKFWLKWKQK